MRLLVQLLGCIVLGLVVLPAHGQRDSLSQAVLTAEFAAMQGKLPCPLSEGGINLKRLYIDGRTKQTLGIDISSARPEVKACFNGTVVSSFPMEGRLLSIIVSHGDYYSIYSQLAESFVESGMEVGGGTEIGKTTGEGDDYQLHFEIWLGTDKLHPTKWLECAE